MTMQFFYFIRE